jgi:hypothetical protein
MACGIGSSDNNTGDIQAGSRDQRMLMPIVSVLELGPKRFGLVKFTAGQRVYVLPVTLHVDKTHPEALCINFDLVFERSHDSSPRDKTWNLANAVPT